MNCTADLPPELPEIPPPTSEHERTLERALDRVPEPWHGRLTARRFRRWLHASRAAARYNAPLPPGAPSMNFFPMRPQPHAPISEIVRILGMRVAYTPRADEPTIAWDGDTWFSPRAARRLPPNAINGRCLDISKSRVERAWFTASGLTLAVDPLVAVGPIVEKSEENGHHAARVVLGPLRMRRKGFVYERLVECRVGHYITQTRPVIVGNRIVLVYEKWRAHPDRFFGTVLSLPRAADELYSADEQTQLLRFARAMDLDYGELDVLRDPDTDELYVVDANRTPSRPHRLPAPYEPFVWEQQAEAFRELLRIGGV